MDYRARLKAIKFELPEFENRRARAPARVTEDEFEPPPLIPHAPVPVPAPVSKEVPAPPGSKHSRRNWLLAAAALSAAAGAALWSTQGAPEPAHRAIPLPFSDAVGMAWHDGLLHSIDGRRLLLYSIEAETGEVRALRKLPSASPGGLAASPEAFWSSELDGAIHEHANDAALTVRRSYRNADRSPTVLHWDGTHLWAADARTETVYQYKTGEALNPMRQYSFPGVRISGLHAADGKLWVLDGPKRELTRFQAKALAIVEDGADLSPWLAAGENPVGLAVREEMLWVITDRPARLHRIPLAKLRWRQAVGPVGSDAGP